MAGKVTGKFGAEEVVLNNAATEATLQSLLKAIDKMPGASPADKKKLKKETDELSRSTGDAADDLDEFGDAAEESTGAMSRLGGGFKGLATGAFSLAMKMGSLGTAFMTGSDRLSDLTSGIPIVSTFTQILDDNLNTYREISSVGATFGNSIASMRLSAATAEMSLEGFQNMVSQNSENMAMLGGTVSDGAERFSRISKELRTSEIGERFMGMGMTISDLNEGVGDFIELQARQGRLDQMSNRQIREGSAAYVEELDALARLTGKSRKEQADLIAQNQAQANVAAMRSKLEGERLANFDASMAAASGISQEFGTVMADLGDGVAQTEFGQKLQSQIPEFGTLAEQMAAGEISSEEFARRMQDLAPQLESFRDEMDPAMIQALMGKGGFDSLLAAITDVSAFASKAADPGEIDEEQARRNQITESLGGFEQTVNSIRSRIVSTFLQSNIFETVVGQLESFVGWLDSEGENGVSNLTGMVDGLMEAMKPVQEWFSNFIATIKSDGLMDAIKEAFSGLGDIIKSALFGGLTEGQEQEQSQLQEEKQRIEGLSPTTETGENYQAKKLEQINSRLNELKEKGENGGILSGILGNFSFPDALKAGGAAVLGIGALAGAFALFGTGPVMAGAAVFTATLVGTGAAIMLAGKGIDLAGDGIQKVSTGLQEMSKIKDVSKLKDIGVSLGSLGTGLKDLAVGGVIESISSFFGADSPFDKVIDGVNKFSDVDQGSLNSLIGIADSLKIVGDVTDNLNVRPLNDFSDAMVKLTGSGVLDKLGSLLPGESGIQKMATDLESLNKIDSSALGSINTAADSLETISSVTDSLDSSPLNEYTDAVVRLTGALENMNSELSGGDEGFFGKIASKITGDSDGDTTAGDVLSGSGLGSSDNVEKLNRTMQDILSVLMASNDVNRKQLGAARSMTADLYRGF